MFKEREIRNRINSLKFFFLLTSRLKSDYHIMISGRLSDFLGPAYSLFFTVKVATGGAFIGFGFIPPPVGKVGGFASIDCCGDGIGGSDIIPSRLSRRPRPIPIGLVFGAAACDG